MDAEGHESFIESRSRSFTNLWPVFEAYAVEDGYVRPFVEGKLITAHGNAGAARDYFPFAHPELPGEFAKLAGKGTGEILAFVHRYGLLGYVNAYSFYELAGVSAAMKLHNAKAPGDPVSWILAHAATVKLVLDLIESVENPDRLAGCIEQLTVAEKGGEVLSYAVASRGFTRPSQAQFPIRGDQRVQALQIVSFILNENIEGISRVLIVESQEGKKTKGLTSLFSSRNLIESIYWLIADAALQGKVKACRHCQRPFIAVNQKSRYCPAPAGNQAVSPCMNRAKQSRFRSLRSTKKPYKPKPKRSKNFLTEQPGRRANRANRR